MNIWTCETHWEQNDGHSQRDGGEDSQTNAEDESVVGVDPAVGVQELGLNVGWGKIKEFVYLACSFYNAVHSDLNISGRSHLNIYQIQELFQCAK